jgi:hypothetical protein
MVRTQAAFKQVSWVVCADKFGEGGGCLAFADLTQDAETLQARHRIEFRVFCMAARRSFRTSVSAQYGAEGAYDAPRYRVEPDYGSIGLKLHSTPYDLLP